MATDWSVLSDAEWAEYHGAYVSYLAARAEQDYKTADALRVKLLQWQERSPDGLWHPVYEQPDHRQRRIEAREAADGL